MIFREPLQRIINCCTCRELEAQGLAVAGFQLTVVEKGNLVAKRIMLVSIINDFELENCFVKPN